MSASVKYGFTALLLVLAVGYYFGNGRYHRVRRDLDARRALIETVWAEVEDDLATRADLVTELAEPLHDHPAAAALLKAKTSFDDAEKPSDVIYANAQLDQALVQYLAIAVPTLKGSRAFTAQREALEDAQNHIAQSRSKYNDAVKAYNQRLSVFPNNLVARLAGYQALTDDHYFKTDILKSDPKTRP